MTDPVRPGPISFFLTKRKVRLAEPTRARVALVLQEGGPVDDTLVLGRPGQLTWRETVPAGVAAWDQPPPLETLIVRHTLGTSYFHLETCEGMVDWQGAVDPDGFLPVYDQASNVGFDAAAARVAQRLGVEVAAVNMAPGDEDDGDDEDDDNDPGTRCFVEVPDDWSVAGALDEYVARILGQPEFSGWARHAGEEDEEQDFVFAVAAAPDDTGFLYFRARDGDHALGRTAARVLATGGTLQDGQDGQVTITRAASLALMHRFLEADARFR
jgi:hypothetical protein